MVDFQLFRRPKPWHSKREQRSPFSEYTLIVWIPLYQLAHHQFRPIFVVKSIDFGIPHIEWQQSDAMTPLTVKCQQHFGTNGPLLRSCAMFATCLFKNKMIRYIWEISKAFTDARSWRMKSVGHYSNKLHYRPFQHQSSRAFSVTNSWFLVEWRQIPFR